MCIAGHTVLHAKSSNNFKVHAHDERLNSKTLIHTLMELFIVSYPFRDSKLLNISTQKHSINLEKA